MTASLSFSVAVSAAAAYPPAFAAKVNAAVPFVASASSAAEKATVWATFQFAGVKVRVVGCTVRSESPEVRETDTVTEVAGCVLRRTVIGDDAPPSVTVAVFADRTTAGATRSANRRMG